MQHYSAHPSESVAGIQLLLRVQAVSKSRRRRPRRRHVRRAVLVSSAATGYAGAAGEGQAVAPLYYVAAGAAAGAATLPPQNLAVHNISERCNEQRGVPGVLAV